MMPRTCVALALVAVGLFAASSSHAQTTVTTDPVGFISTNCLGNSDTFLSTPFTRPSEFVGTVASVTGSTVFVSGTPGWTANQFVYVSGTQPKTYYAIFGPATSGTYAREGAIYTVAANDTGSLTLNLNGDDISSIAATTPQVTVIPYWTLGTLFPDGDINLSYTPTTSILSMKTQICIPNYSGTGTNLAPKTIYFYYTSGTNIGWRLTNDLVTSQADQVLLPGGYFIVRNRGSASTSLIVTGAVYTKKFGLPVFTQSSQGQDNFVSHGRPVDVSLTSLGLSPTLGTFTATASVLGMKDQILLYDNTTTVINKASSKTYFFYLSGTNNGWRAWPDLATPRDSDTIPAGSAMIIRKASNGSGTSNFWTNTPTF